MSLTIGKRSINTATGKIPIHEPTGFNQVKQVGTLKVTCKVLGEEGFEEVQRNCGNDIEMMKEMITDIAPADSKTQLLDAEGNPIEEYTPDMLDGFYKEYWQWNPILEFVLQVNDIRTLKLVQRKNS